MLTFNILTRILPMLAMLRIDEVEATDFFLALTEQALGPTFEEILSPGLSKLECSLRCSGSSNCDGYNFTPAPGSGSNAKCQLLAMGLNSTAAASVGTEAWLSGTPASGFLKARFYSDKKLYAFILQDAAPWDEAETFCYGVGAGVASVTNEEKFRFFIDGLIDYRDYGYMGMRDTAIQGYYVDSRGNTNPWSLNYPNEPGLQGPEEDCLVGWYYGAYNKWVTGDDRCSAAGPWICEFPRRDPDVGCFEQPPKPEGAMYQNWDGESYPLGVGAVVTSVCQSGQRFHTGISTYSATCGLDGYWIRHPPPIPFCTGTKGFLQGNASVCYKLLQETIVFARSATARCQQLGGKTLTFTAATAAIFRTLLFPARENEPPGIKVAIAGYDDVAQEGIFRDAEGNIMPSGLWVVAPNGGTAENYVMVWFPDFISPEFVYDEWETNEGQLICTFTNC